MKLYSTAGKVFSALALTNGRHKQWITEKGTHEVLAGSSSRHLRLRATVQKI